MVGVCAPSAIIRTVYAALALGQVTRVHRTWCERVRVGEPVFKRRDEHEAQRDALRGQWLLVYGMHSGGQDRLNDRRVRMVDADAGSDTGLEIRRGRQE